MTVERTGGTVVLGAGDPVSAAISWAVNSPVGDLTSAIDGAPDGVVVVVGADPGPEAADMRDLSDEEWHRLTEQPMRRVLIALQHARSAFGDRGGRIVVVVPTVGLSGSAGIVPYTTVVEGVRSMVKSAARQWISCNIRVNTVAVALPLLTPGADVFGSHLTAAAVPVDHTALDTIVDAALFLLRPDCRHLTGATIVADGGSVMLP